LKQQYQQFQEAKKHFKAKQTLTNAHLNCSLSFAYGNASSRNDTQNFNKQKHIEKETMLCQKKYQP
jgi:hypothetical protein